MLIVGRATMSQTHSPLPEEPTTTSAPPEPPAGENRKRAFTFCGSSFGVVRLEDVHEIANLKADLVVFYRPLNSQEMFAIERMAIAQQLILRAARLDAGLFTSAMNDVINSDNNPIVTMDPDMIGADIEITRQQNRNFCLAEGFRRIAKESDLMNLALRYRIQAERDYRRALEEFQRLERRRPKLPNQPDLLTDPDGKDDIAHPWELNPWIPKPPAPVQESKAAETMELRPVSAAIAPFESGQQPAVASAQPATRAGVVRVGKAPQPSFTKTFAAGAAPQLAGLLLNLSFHAPATHSGFELRNNTLVPVVEPNGSGTEETPACSDIRSADLVSARPRARAPRLNNKSETALRVTGNTCRKHFSAWGRASTGASGLKAGLEQAVTGADPGRPAGYSVSEVRTRIPQLR